MPVTDPWCIDHYVPRYPYFLLEKGMTTWEAEHVFQLEPEPPEVEDENEYILRAQKQPNKDAFYLFLHHYEKRLNKRINQIIIGDAQLRYNPERFLDLKMHCVIRLLDLVPTYDPNRGAKFTTYVYHFLEEAVHRYCMEEEHWAMPSFDIYRQLRKAAYVYNQSANVESAIQRYMEETGCTRKTALIYLKEAIDIRNLDPTWGETAAMLENLPQLVGRDPSMRYLPITIEGIPINVIRKAFWSLKLDRDRELLEARLAIIMKEGEVLPITKQITFDELATRYGLTGPSSIKNAYEKAVQRFAESLWNDGWIRAVKFQRISKTKTAAVYQYQADCDGEWGELELDFLTGESTIKKRAQWDTKNPDKYSYANKIIDRLMKCEKLPKSGTFYFAWTT